MGNQKLPDSLSRWLINSDTKKILAALAKRREELITGLIAGNLDYRYRIKELDIILNPEELQTLLEE